MSLRFEDEFHDRENQRCAEFLFVCYVKGHSLLQTSAVSPQNLFVFLKDKEGSLPSTSALLVMSKFAILIYSFMDFRSRRQIGCVCGWPERRKKKMRNDVLFVCSASKRASVRACVRGERERGRKRVYKLCLKPAAYLFSSYHKQPHTHTKNTLFLSLVSGKAPPRQAFLTNKSSHYLFTFPDKLFSTWVSSLANLTKKSTTETTSPSSLTNLSEVPLPLRVCDW